LYENQAEINSGKGALPGRGRKERTEKEKPIK
jgi:hypothetical protein